MTDYVAGWNIDATSGALFAGLPTAIAVPSSAAFNAGAAFSQDGYRYCEVVANVPATAAFVGGVAHRHDGAVYVKTSGTLARPGIATDGALVVDSTGPATAWNGGLPYSATGIFGGVADLSAVDYDGSNDYATRGANLTNVVDGKAGTFSVWTRIDGGNGTVRVIVDNATTVGGATTHFAAFLQANNAFRVQGINSAGTTIMAIDASATVAGTAWRHFLASWDLTDNAKRHLYVNDVSDLTVPSYSNDTIDYGVADWSVGAQADGTLKYNGCISQLFFHTTYLDLSVEANRRKFITATGRPAFLGATGALPLGVQPVLYAPNGNPSTNAGSGGNLTVVGTLDACSSLPGV